jgi:IS5 family transposase
MIPAVSDCRQNLPAHSKSLQSALMKPTSSDTAQTSFLLPDLEKQLDPRSLLYRLAQAIDWKGFEKTFGSLYSTEGRPALPIRRMVGLLMLKSLRNLSDEEVVEFWSESAYAQYFCGEKEMRWGLPCDPSELTHFRKRIGTDGAERILASTIDLHGEKGKEKEVVVDTTVQEKNITFPTDTKLAAKIVRGGVKLANKHGVKLRQSFERTVPKLLAAQRGRRTKGGAVAARKAARRLRTIAGQVVRQLDAGLPAETKDRRWLETAVRVLNQKRKDGDKIYSLHEPEVYCMSKGKEHKKYEFGAKASVVVGKNSGVILGAYSLPKNDYDGHALEPTLAQVERVSGYRPTVAIGDKGFRGKTHCGTTEVVTPNRPKKNATAYEKRKAKARFRRRAAIEPRIGHLKSDFRLGRNFLKGQVGDAINLLLAAAASNLSLWMRQILFALVSAIQNWTRECRTFRSPLPA